MIAGSNMIPCLLPNACVLQDGTLFAMGSHEGLGKNEYGPAGAEVTSMQFRIKGPKEGKGIPLLPVGGTSSQETE